MYTFLFLDDISEPIYFIIIANNMRKIKYTTHGACEYISMVCSASFQSRELTFVASSYCISMLSSNSLIGKFLTNINWPMCLQNDKYSASAVASSQLIFH